MCEELQNCFTVSHLKANLVVLRREVERGGRWYHGVCVALVGKELNHKTDKH